jgi:nucleoside-triphosphatase THEP1
MNYSNGYTNRNWRIQYARRFLSGKKVVELLKRQDPLTVEDNFLNTIYINVIPIIHNQGNRFTLEQVPDLEQELNEWAAFELRPDNKKDNHWLLSVRSAYHDLLLIPAFPLWKAIGIRNHTKIDAPSHSLSVKWELHSTEENGKVKPSPISSSILVNAKIKKNSYLHQSQLCEKDKFDLRFLQLKDRRIEIENAFHDLDHVLKLLRVARDIESRKNWYIELEQVESKEKSIYQYKIQSGHDDEWRKTGQTLYGKNGENEFKVEAFCDLDTEEEIWYVISSRPMNNYEYVYESKDNPYWWQEKIVNEIFLNKAINSDYYAAIGTQILLESTNETKDNNDFGFGSNHHLPGEKPWEDRQLKALELAMSGDNIVAIKGPPGTGKSTVITGIIRRLIRNGMRVLFVAPTHVALDEVLRRLDELLQNKIEKEILAARIVPKRDIHIDPELRKYEADKLGVFIAAKATDQLSALPYNFPIDKNEIGEIEKLQKDIQRYKAIKAILTKFKTSINEFQKNKKHLTEIRDNLKVLDEQGKLKIDPNYLELKNLSLTKTDRENLLNQTNEMKLIAESMRQKLKEHVSEMESVKTEKINIESRIDELKKENKALKIQLSNFTNNFYGLKIQDNIEDTYKVISDYKRELTFFIERNKELHQELTGLFDQQREVKDWFVNLKAASLPERRQMSIYYEEKQQLSKEIYEEIGILKSKISSNQNYINDIKSNISNNKVRLSELKSIRKIDNQLSGIEKNIERKKKQLDGAYDFLERKNNKIKMLKSDVESIETNIEDMKADHQAILLKEKSIENCNARSCLGLSINNIKDKILENKRLGIYLDKVIKKIGYKGDFNDLDSKIIAAEKRISKISRTANYHSIKRNLAQRWFNWLKSKEAEERLRVWSIKSLNLVAGTTQGIASSPLFRDETFDVLICDECSRVTRGEILVPAARCERVILVGDEKQLPPYIESVDENTILAFAAISKYFHKYNEVISQNDIEESIENMESIWRRNDQNIRPIRVNNVIERATQLVSSSLAVEFLKSNRYDSFDWDFWQHISKALTVSSFEHALNFIPEERIVRLDIQRRMPDKIACLVRDCVYNGDFKTGNDYNEKSLGTDFFPGPLGFLDTRLMKGSFKNPRYRDERVGTGFMNVDEAKLVAKIVMDHQSKLSVTKSNAMVITFYLAQARAIREYLRNYSKNVKVLPIDRCQGQEADLVIISMVRSNPKPNEGYGLWLQDHCRLNVALTRARRKLIIIGNFKMLENLSGNQKGCQIIRSIISTMQMHPEWVVVEI